MFHRIPAEVLRLRTITQTEYDAVPFRYKTTLGLLLCRSGIMLLLAVLFTIATIIGTIVGAMRGENVWIAIFVYGAIDLFFISIPLVGVQERLTMRITPDTLVTAGEVKACERVRSRRGTVLRGIHTVEIPADDVSVTVTQLVPINSGTTVLVAKSTRTAMFLVPIAREAADFGLHPESERVTAHHLDQSGALDLEGYRKTTMPADVLHAVEPELYQTIPAAYRGRRPFGHGWVSGFWVGWTLLTLVMLVLLVRYAMEHRAEVFFPLMMGFLCVGAVELIVSPTVLRVPLPQMKSVYVACVPIGKKQVNGHCYVHAAFPEKKALVEDIEIEPMLFDAVPIGRTVRLYYRTGIPLVQYIQAC